MQIYEGAFAVKRVCREVNSDCSVAFFYQLLFYIDSASVTRSVACTRFKVEKIVGTYASVCMGKFKLRNTVT